MRAPLQEYLEQILESTSGSTDGAVADYIPELAQADPDRAALALCTADGVLYVAGDHDATFSIQSMSKPFAYAAAIEARGLERVLDHVGVEPSGDAFNELSLDEDGRPSNPMINAGAIVTHSLIGDDEASSLDDVMRLMGALATRDLEIDEAVASSELEKADRNLGLAYLMHGSGALRRDPRATVEGYIEQCAASVTVADLALMAATLANGGAHARTGEQVLSRQCVRQVLSIMSTCGMYDAAGDWASTVGIPAKSGVSGGIIGVLPGQIGVAVFSPRLDAHGNSVRGVELMRRMSADLDLHLLDASRPVKAALRSVETLEVDGEPTTVYRLQGDIMLTSIEALTRSIVEDPPETAIVVFDMSRVDHVFPVARRTSATMMTTLVDEGYRVVAIDPDGTLEAFSDTTGRSIEYWSAEQLERGEHRSAGRE